jgi:hypothetical protein
MRCEDKDMALFEALVAVAVLTTSRAVPGFAQAAIREKGSFAFDHQNLDVLNGDAPASAGRRASQPHAAIEADTSRESGVAASRPSGASHQQSPLHTQVKKVTSAEQDHACVAKPWQGEGCDMIHIAASHL